MAWNEEIKKELGSCGEEVFIGEHVIFTNPKGVHLGNRVRIDPFTLITTGLQVGNNVQICSHAVLGGGSVHNIRLGDWTFIGYGSKLFCGSEDYSGNHGPVNDYWGSNYVHHGDIVFNDYSGVASDVIVFPRVELPIGTTIGAKSMVRPRELCPWTIYVGNPLVFHGERNKDKVIELAHDPAFLKVRS